MKIPTVDLFSGIGGHSLALRSITKVVLYCEIEQAQQHILLKNMQQGHIDKAPIHDDIKTLKGSQIRGARMITASPPCQDLSSLGLRKGLHGSKSKLVFEVIRLIDEAKTIDAVFLENVANILNLGGSKIIKALVDRGFQVRFGIFTAEEVGAPHRRSRWYCLAVRKHTMRFPLLKPSVFPFAEQLQKVPRLTARDEYDLLNRRRISMLGNAILPCVASFAWQCLVNPQSPITKVTKLSSVIVHIDNTGISFTEKPVLQGLKKPNERWQTPVHNISQSIPYDNTKRNREMFASRVFLDQRTKQQFHYSKIHLAAQRYIINPIWVETLMGFPRDWTKPLSNRAGSSLPH